MYESNLQVEIRNQLWERKKENNRRNITVHFLNQYNIAMRQNYHGNKSKAWSNYYYFEIKIRAWSTREFYYSVRLKRCVSITCSVSGQIRLDRRREGQKLKYTSIFFFLFHSSDSMRNDLVITDTTEARSRFFTGDENGWISVSDLFSSCKIKI